MTELTVNGAPHVASQRGYLRRGLPEAYQFPEDNFGMKFVGALEEVLDPIVAMLDLMPAHLDVDLAPEAMIDVMGAWLGTPAIDAALTPAARRALVRNASELTRTRGTTAGLGRLLALALPALHLRVDDTGGATWGSDPDERRPAPDRRVTITPRRPLDPASRALVLDVARSVVPAGVEIEVSP